MEFDPAPHHGSPLPRILRSGEDYAKSAPVGAPPPQAHGNRRFSNRLRAANHKRTRAEARLRLPDWQLARSPEPIRIKVFVREVHVEDEPIVGVVFHLAL